MVPRPGYDVSRPAPAGRSSERPQTIVPPVLYLPCAGPPTEWGTEVEMRRTKDGRVALLAYTALDRLIDCLGPDQPWILYHTEHLKEIGADQPYEVIYLDLPVPQELWHSKSENEVRP